MTDWFGNQGTTCTARHLSEQSTVQLSRMPCTWPFQALADESRFRVVRLLASMGTPLAAGQLAAALACPPNHISRHLHVLESAGLTRVERKGRFHMVSLRSDGASESLAAAVLRMPDHEKTLAGDLARLLDAPPPLAPAGAYWASGAGPGPSSGGASPGL